MTFKQKLAAIQKKNNTLLCVGLDTDIAKIPACIKNDDNPQLEFNRCIIESTKDLVCAYKLNLAFYESAGTRCYETIRKTLELIPPEVVTIGDGKRGDIGNTAEHYARVIFDDWKFDAATVNPYMGKDSVEPFIISDEHGIFLLALTSNRGAKDFQYLPCKGKPLYEHVVRRAIKWNAHGNIGLVVGATHPSELKRIRSIAKEMPLLIPGIGAQQGDLDKTVRYGCTKQGDMAIINISRGIIYASVGDDFDQVSRNSAETYRDRINTVREEYFFNKLTNKR
jgi:orotidine-5'-phosphate decarboxylase